MEPESLGIKPLYTCWIKELDDMLTDLAAANAANAGGGNAQQKDKEEEGKKKKEKKDHSREDINKKLTNYMDTYLERFIKFVRKEVVEICPTVNSGLAFGVMRIIDTFFDKYRAQEAQFKNMSDDLKKTNENLEGIFFFSLIWGLGVTTNEAGRKAFNKFFRDFTHQNAIDKKFLVPSDKTVYDYLFDQEKSEWVLWKDNIPKLDISPTTEYTEIIVPTPDSVRNSFIIKQLILSNKHVLTSGPTGTGKTVNIMEVIGKGLGNKYMNIVMNFSAQTTARQVQDTVQGKIKKRGRARYAPEKTAALFIDDVNMPIQQTSSAQPAIEILRQWQDYGGWYLYTNKTFIQIENIILSAAMGVKNILLIFYF
ncbi:MAG: hypothetical protein MJ252_11690 [archaeon]|nr:hypothetical protein [archaeon]